MLVRQWKGSRLSVAMISSLAELPRIAPHQDIKNTKGYNFKAMLVAEVDSELSVQSHHVTRPLKSNAWVLFLVPLVPWWSICNIRHQSPDGPSALRYTRIGSTSSRRTLT